MNAVYVEVEVKINSQITKLFQVVNLFLSYIAKVVLVMYYIIAHQKTAPSNCGCGMKHWMNFLYEHVSIGICLQHMTDGSS